jgi:low affinity Fe/Cu permease
MDELFHKIAAQVSAKAGQASTFILALLIILVWAVSGLFFNFSDTWQLVINTGTTIITFLMVFLIQNTQNRDSKAIHLKLDELIKAIHGARNTMVNLEELSDEELEELHLEFKKLQDHSTQELTKRQKHKK